jgi:glutaredoxin
MIKRFLLKTKKTGLKKSNKDKSNKGTLTKRKTTKNKSNKDKIKVLGRMSCPYTREAITVLKDKKMTYKFYNLEKAHNRELLDKLKNKGKVPHSWHTVPIIIKKNKFIGGMDELDSMLNS